MSGEHSESGEPDRSGDPVNCSKTLDELSREEILRALAGLDEQLRADPEDAYSFLARGMLYSRLGDDRRAAEDFSRVIELEPDNAEALENRAAARTDLGQLHLAREDYASLLRLEPDNAAALYSRGACLARLDDLAAAVGLRQDHPPTPGDAVSFYNHGCTYPEMGNPRQALADFDGPITLHAGNPSSTITGTWPA